MLAEETAHLGAHAPGITQRRIEQLRLDDLVVMQLLLELIAGSLALVVRLRRPYLSDQPHGAAVMRPGMLEDIHEGILLVSRDRTGRRCVHRRAGAHRAHCDPSISRRCRRPHAATIRPRVQGRRRMITRLAPSTRKVGSRPPTAGGMPYARPPYATTWFRT